MGLVSSGVVLAKLILHEACRLKLDWKQRIPNHLIDKWSIWKENSKYLPQTKLNRCILLPHALYELHGFCDASTEAFAAVVYLISRAEQLTLSNIVASKTRVAPFQPMSIPWLRACGSTIGQLIDSSPRDAKKNWISPPNIIILMQRIYYIGLCPTAIPGQFLFLIESSNYY